MFSNASTQTPPGENRLADVAGPPFPEMPMDPLPATVLIMPTELSRLSVLKGSRYFEAIES